jgi:hypothetical protein
LKVIDMKKNQNRNGQALVMVTVGLTMMLGLMSLAVDLGWGYFQRESAQSAADAAAAAAVRVVEAVTSAPVCGTGKAWCGSPAGTITNCPATKPASATNSYDSACILAYANGGFTTTGSTTVSVQANTTSPAPTVPGVAVSYWVTVRISETPGTFFGIPLVATGGSGLATNVIATSAITTSGSASSPPCLYILGTTGTTFTLGNGAVVTASSCGVYINSNDTTGNKAMWVTSRLNSPTVSIVGGDLVNNGGCLATSPTAACGSLTPTTGASAIADPFVNLPPPTIPSSCASGNFTSWQATPYQLTTTGSNQGCYDGMSLGNGMSAVMGPGTYVINGGTFSVQGGSTLTATSGVMIYLTNGATVNIANGATVNMSAEGTGTYEGILFFQDRTMASPAASTFAGGANQTLTGSLYFPNSLLNINNGSNSSTEAVVAGSVNFQGGATFKQATTQAQTGLVVNSSATSVLQ